MKRKDAMARLDEAVRAYASDAATMGSWGATKHWRAYRRALRALFVVIAEDAVEAGHPHNEGAIRAAVLGRRK